MNSDLKAAVVRMVERMAALKYFPADVAARRAIMELLAGIASSAEQVQRFEHNLLVAHPWNEWEGPGKLREAFCRLFPPRDGIESGTYQGEMAFVTREEPVFLDLLPQSPVAMIEGGTEFIESGDSTDAQEQERRLRAVLRKAPRLENLREVREFRSTKNHEEREGLLYALEGAPSFAQRTSTQLQPSGFLQKKKRKR